jgi:adenine-specific DNA-methyltransferase
MTLAIKYMGTKRQLAPRVADAVATGRDGIFLDAFSGMASLGQAIGDTRAVWANDAQRYAFAVAQSLFASKDPPFSATAAVDLLHDLFRKNFSALEDRFQTKLAREDVFFDSSTFAEARKNWADIGIPSDDRAPAHLRQKPSTFEYRLFSVLYGNTYIGVRQAAEVDSLCYALDAACKRHEISEDQRRWGLVGLGAAMLKVATTTGHFAQFLSLKSTNFKRYIAARRRSIWTEWIEQIQELSPIGSKAWRQKNRCFNLDAIALLQTLRRYKYRPAVVYADPPYTEDHYSRYYHLLETLMLYDYPKVAGVGRYRPGRFQSSFSIKSKCADSFDRFIEGCSTIGAELLLSYPENGLLHKVGVDPADALRKHYRSVSVMYFADHMHSTLGASKGGATAPVREILYRAAA